MLTVSIFVCLTRNVPCNHIKRKCHSPVISRQRVRAFREHTPTYVHGMSNQLTTQDPSVALRGN